MARWSEMSWWSARNFDERQLRVRGDVFLHGLIEALVLMAVLLAVPRGWAPSLYPSLIAAVAVVIAASVEMIWRGAYLPLGRRGERMRRFWRVVGAVYAVILVLYVVAAVVGDGGLWSDGALTGAGAFAVLYLLICVIPLMLLLADRRDARLARAEALADEPA